MYCDVCLFLPMSTKRSHQRGKEKLLVVWEPNDDHKMVEHMTIHFKPTRAERLVLDLMKLHRCFRPDFIHGANAPSAFGSYFVRKYVLEPTWKIGDPLDSSDDEKHFPDDKGVKRFLKERRARRIKEKYQWIIASPYIDPKDKLLPKELDKCIVYVQNLLSPTGSRNWGSAFALNWARDNPTETSAFLKIDTKVDFATAWVDEDDDSSTSSSSSSSWSQPPVPL
jgi:hypothetical protein